MPLWAMILNPGTRYGWTSTETFHISMASLDISSADDNPVQVMGGVEETKDLYLICSLDKKNVWQVPLNMVVQKETYISFVCKGRGNVHLTGYTMKDVMYKDIPDREKILQALKLPEKKDKKVESISSLKRKANPPKDEIKHIKPSTSFKEKDDDDNAAADDDDDDDNDDDYEFASGDEDDDGLKIEIEDEDENEDEDDDDDDNDDGEDGDDTLHDDAKKSKIKKQENKDKKQKGKQQKG